MTRFVCQTTYQAFSADLAGEPGRPVRVLGDGEGEAGHRSREINGPSSLPNGW